MDNGADLVQFAATWPQAIVAVALIVGVLFVPQLGAYVQARRSASAVNDVRQTLTTNNGGSHVKDSLDRIEVALSALTGRVDALEHPRRTWRRR